MSLETRFRCSIGYDRVIPRNKKIFNVSAIFFFFFLIIEDFFATDKNIPLDTETATAPETGPFTL